MNHFKLTQFYFTNHNLHLTALIIITDFIPCYANVYTGSLSNGNKHLDSFK